MRPSTCCARMALLLLLSAGVARAESGPVAGLGARKLVPTNRAAGGSQGGRWYQDEVHSLWFAKPAKADAHGTDRLASEHLMNRIYRLAAKDFGTEAPETELTSIAGHPHFISREWRGTTPRTAEDRDAAAVFRRGFVIDAWLANWDVGAPFNLTSIDGRYPRIDSGGAGLFRARGKLKGARFGVEVEELFTMREAKSASSPMFAAITDEDVAAQLRAFSTWYARHRTGIAELIEASPLSAGLKAELTQKLAARAAWMQTEGLARLASASAPAANMLAHYLDGTQKEPPGKLGVPIERRPTEAELKELTGRWGGICLAVTYVRGAGKKGGGGRYFLHSGDAFSLSLPRSPDRMLIYRTHPSGRPEASGQDRMDLRFNKDIGNPQRSSMIVAVGEEPAMTGRLKRLVPRAEGAIRYDERTPSTQVLHFLERAGVPVASGREVKALEDRSAPWKPGYATVVFGPDWEEVSPHVLNENTIADAIRIDRAFSRLGFREPHELRFLVRSDGHLEVSSLGQLETPINWGPPQSPGKLAAGHDFGGTMMYSLAVQAEAAIAKRRSGGLRPIDLRNRTFLLDGTRVIVPVAPQKHDSTEEELILEARTLLDRQDEKIRALLPTSGYADLNALREALRKGGARLERAARLFDEESELDFAMNRPLESRESIAAHGLQSVHVTGLTGGARGNGGSVGVRSAVEASYLGMAPEEFAVLDPQSRPQYGYLKPSPASQIGAPLVGYGSDTYIFKKARMRDYITFTPGDSLNRWRDDEGNRVVTSRTRAAPPAQSWDQLYVPWKYRLLLAPFVQEGRLSPDPPSWEGFSAHWLPLEHYFELQFWRQPTLEDVERFEFSRVPPSGDFLKALRAHHVAIFQVMGDGTRVPFEEQSGAARAE